MSCRDVNEPPTLYTRRAFDPATGLYYYRHRVYHPQLGRFVSRDQLGFLSGVNHYQYAVDSPLTYFDPMGLEVPDNPSLFEISTCQSLLEWAATGGAIIYPCASELLWRFLGHSGQYVGTVCPQACLTKLKEADFARPSLTQLGDKQAECGKEGKGLLPEYWSDHDYVYEEGDMYYGLKDISWSGWAHGTVSCGEGQIYTSNGQEMCCCECSADLCFHATVTDEYDFCSSLEEDEAFSLPWCGCVIEKAQEFLSLAGTTIGKPFDIECLWAEETGVSFTHCEEV